MNPNPLMSNSEFVSWCESVANSWDGSQTSFHFADQRLHRSVKLKTKDGQTLVDACALCLDDCIAVGINEKRSFEALVSGLRKQIKKTTTQTDVGFMLLDSSSRRKILPFEKYLTYELPNGCYLLTKKGSSSHIGISQNMDNVDLPEYQPAKVTTEPCFRAITSLPDTATLARHLKLSKEVFILQNRLTQMADDLDGQEFSDALMHAVECDKISFRCTLYHPKSQIALERQSELGEELCLWIKQCIEKLHLAIRKSLDRTGKKQFDNCEFRIATAHLPYTIYGFDNRIYLGWLVAGSQSNNYDHLVLQGPTGAFEVVKKFFDTFWRRSTLKIDLATPVESILEDPTFSVSENDLSTYQGPCNIPAKMPDNPGKKKRDAK